MLQDIKGFVYEFCRDQHGSRFIQQKLAVAPPEELMAVYQEVEPHVIPLMQDVFGNYVIQKCFEHGTKVRRHSLSLRHRQLQVECSRYSINHVVVPAVGRVCLTALTDVHPLREVRCYHDVQHKTRKSPLPEGFEPSRVSAYT